MNRTLISVRWTNSIFEGEELSDIHIGKANIFRKIFEEYINSINIDLKTTQYVYTGGRHSQSNKPHIHIHYALDGVEENKKLKQDNFKYYYNNKAENKSKLELGMLKIKGVHVEVSYDNSCEQERDVFLQYPLKEGADLFDGGEHQPENKVYLEMKAMAEWRAVLRHREKKALEEENRENQEKVIYTLLKENKLKIIEMGLNIQVNIVSFLQDQLPIEVKEKRLKRPPSIPKLMGEVQKFLFYDLGILTPETLVKKYL